jgi:hypothetical protein
MGLPHPKKVADGFTPSKKSSGRVYLIPKKVGDGLASSQKSSGWVYLIPKKVVDGFTPSKKRVKKNKEQKVLKQHEENINYRGCGIFRLTFM